MLTIPQSVWQSLGELARAAYPRECCGILLGRPGPGASLVERLWPVANHRVADPETQFEIPNSEVIRASDSARCWGGEVVGFYHSHPDHAVCFSAADTANAWPDYSNLVLGVRDGRLDGAACFIVDRATGQARSEPIG